jgi:3-isopropylmalate dehydrogenase
VRWKRREPTGVEYSFEEPPGARTTFATGETLPPEAEKRLKSDFDAIPLGALGPAVPGNEHARHPVRPVRADLYVNLRPVRPPPGPLLRSSPDPDGARRAIDLVVFRENTEGAYVNVGGNFKRGTPDEVAINEDLNTCTRA